MKKLQHSDLYTLEAYDKKRSAMRSQIMQHKKARVVHLGKHISLYFEDRQTILYQIQEMLRAEKIYTEDGIAEELDTYNPLIPDGSNWKATMMIEYKDPKERAVWLQKLIGVERQLYLQINDLEKVYPIANEDLTRETADKTSAVHFLRFELSDAMIAAVKEGAGINFCVAHPNYTAAVDIGADTTASLANDLA
ncbi:MAG: DUF3501 family protein [Chromatiales bacterium]|nr:DUF3501 family protein [Chromatiales bacterium]